MQRKHCIDCKFFFPGTGDRYSECRFNPPIWKPDPLEGGTLDGWPEVEPEDWCGKLEDIDPDDNY